MLFYDLIHGYQPFEPEVTIPKWVKRNLKNIFLPTSLAMREGLVRRGIQLQGWTIDRWLATPARTRNLAKKVLANLREAARLGHLEIGISAYSHPILPMLSDDLIQTQIILDQEVVEKYLGKPTWFWPPEGAIDKRALKIIHQAFPDLIILVSDKAIGKYNFNSPIKIKFKDGLQKAIVFNSLFKDLFMNAEDYRRRPKYMRRPKHLPKELVWARVRRTVHSPKIFLEVLEYLYSTQNFHNSYIRNKFVIRSPLFVLMRDWENAGSRKGLRKITGPTRTLRVGPVKKDIGVFLKLKDKIDFRLPSQFDWKRAEVVPLAKILPCSWDMESTLRDPFPWWQPSKYGKIWRHRKPFRRKRILEWQELVKEFDENFQERVKAMGGLKKALKNKKFKSLLKKTLPALHSCVGWHYFAKRAWKPDYQYSREALENIVLPALDLMKRA